MTQPPAAGAIGVTGSSGRLGRSVVADLLVHSYDVVGLDRTAPATEDHRYVPWDGRTVDVIRDALRGCSALIHLAAIPGPWSHPDEVVFGNNTTATFAALQAAADLGIERVAIASSGSAYGTAWSPEPSHARYVPVDEAHPMLNADPYGLSKEVDERTAEMFCRRYPMSVAALRFHWICDRFEQLQAIAAQHDPRDWPSELRNLWGYVDHRDAARACRLAIEAVGSRHEPGERSERQPLRRAGYGHEPGERSERQPLRRAGYGHEPGERSERQPLRRAGYGHEPGERSERQPLRRAGYGHEPGERSERQPLRRAGYGFVPMNIVAADALSEVPVPELLAAHAPDIEIRGRIGPTDGAFAIERAAEVIGWRPRHSWRHPE